MEIKEGEIRMFKVPFDFKSEGRVFYEKEVYKAEYVKWTEDELSVHFHAENGWFNFAPELFERVIIGWGLKEEAE